MFDDSSQTGARGVALINKIVLDMGHVWHERQRDAGVDGEIEFRDPSTGVVANRFILVQSKARDGLFSGENGDRFYFLCEQRDIDYWMSADVPVILVCSHPNSGDAWWAHVQSWFADPVRRESRRIDFDKKTQKFDHTAADRLLGLADPAGAAHTPVALARDETLTSSLLPVRIPATIFAAPVKASRGRDINGTVREHRPGPQAWLYRSGHVYSFRDPDELGLADLITGPVGHYDTLLFGSEEKSRQNVVQQLLGRALREDCASEMVWDADAELLAFKATSPVKTTRMEGPYGKMREVVTVRQKSSGSGVRWVRHLGMRFRFILDVDEWIMNVTPDYRFTVDGFRTSKYAGENLSKIKRIERHAAVKGHFDFLVHYLQRPTESLFGTQERWLHFDPPLSFKVDRGLDDDAWNRDRLTARADGSTASDQLTEDL